MPDVAEIVDRVSSLVDRDRLLDTALRLCTVYSPTRNAGKVSDVLASLLADEGFNVERPTGGWPTAPAVAVRFSSERPGRTLQFDGHLDTVHLPFMTPQVSGERLTGSGSSDMKAGVAAAVEALRAVHSGLLNAGSVLFTAHDLHESPWGDGSQLEGIIDAGYVGDAVLIPEYLCDVLAVAGRGQATYQLRISRPGPPVHEVLRPLDEPSVIAAGAECVRRFAAWNSELSEITHPIAGSPSVFVGQIHSGEIYNQFPQQCVIEGTRRWLPGDASDRVEADFRARIADLATATCTNIETKFMKVRDAFQLDPRDPLVAAFQDARTATGEKPLPIGGKRFVDDGNTFWSRAGVAAITHGPLAGGVHTLDEWVSIDDLVRVAQLYAVAALLYCAG